MTKLLVIMFALVIVCFSLSADAYLIKVQCCAPDGTCDSMAGQLGGSEPEASFTPLGVAVNPEASYAVYQNNDPVNGALGHTQKFTTSPVAWYGTVIRRDGYSGPFDLRFFSTTTTSKLATGMWYLYKGIVPIRDGMAYGHYPICRGSFTTNVSTWASSSFGAVLNDGDQWTLTLAPGLLEPLPEPDTPEPSSILALCAGLSGLVCCRMKVRSC